MIKIKYVTTAITLSILITGCSQDTQNITTDTKVETIEVDKKVETTIPEDIISNEIIGNPTTEQILETKSKITQGLSNLEIVKIKTAFLMMMDSIERGKTENFLQIIQDLESILVIAEYEPFKNDLLTIQKILQHALDSGGVEAQEYAVKMLNDLTLFGVDFPYDRKSSKSIEAWPKVAAEDTFFGTTQTWNQKYPESIKDITNGVEISVSDIYDLRADMKEKQKLIDDELVGINTQDLELIKSLSLEVSDTIFEMRTSLIENNYAVEVLQKLFSDNEQQLKGLLLRCIDELSDGKLKTEYIRMLGYINYASTEVQNDTFDYDLVLVSLNGTQETLDDICVSVLGNTNPVINKRYSESTSMLEDPPVLYDWINHVITGVYPEGGKPITNFFRKALYLNNN